LASLEKWLRSIIPASVHLSHREKFRSSVGAMVGILLTAAFTRLMVGSGIALPLLIAPMGASAVLLFGVPASPLAQPWSLIGGNLLSATVGVTCANFIGEPVLAAAVAVAASIGLMFLLRCLHPPSGAVALTAVLGGPAVHSMGYAFALMPVGVNSIALLASAIAFHTLTGHRYPHRQFTGETEGTTSKDRVAMPTKTDLLAALDRRDELLDVDLDDLQDLLQATQLRAYSRHLGELSCSAVMTADVKSVTPTTAADAAWALLLLYRIKALPVVDAGQRVIGIVTQIDFIGHARNVALRQLQQDEIKAFRRTSVDEPHLVKDIMTANVKTALVSQAIVELVPLFADCGHHHLPVVDSEGRLKGMVTQADLVAGLHRRSLLKMQAAA
jgi:CBS domain-containing membrane protein